MPRIYRFADRLVRVEALFPEVHSLCADYLASGAPDFCVQITRTDIEAEREKSAREDIYEGRPVRQFSDAYLETVAVYRKIAERIPAYDTVLFHGSCVAVDGVGYLFTAKSGTGKSTHTRLWRELLGDRVVMVNDDKPLIRMTQGGVVIYGTPWDGKHHLSANISVPLKAICILERAEENTIRQVTLREAFPMLLQQVYRPADAASMRKTLAVIQRLAESVRLWRLECNMQIEAAQLAYDTMRG